MKVAIITYNRAYNYGAVLQAYALNAFLWENGHEAHTIDFCTEQQRNKYRIFKPYKGFLSVVRNALILLYCKDLKKLRLRFDSFLEQYLPMTEKAFTKKEELVSLETAYDAFICGSDQIWNPNLADFDESYLLSFVKDKAKCFSYAPSIAISNLPEKWESIFRKELSGYSTISCREEKGAEIIKKLTGRDVTVVLDPVFLLEKEKWDNIAIQTRKKPYILCYFLGKYTKEMRSFAQRMHKETRMPLVTINMNLRDILYPNVIKNYSAGPREFIGLIRDAEYVCTNSFHAVAFSLIYGKNFWVFINTKSPKSSSSRIENITEMCKIQDRVIRPEVIGKIDIQKPIDFSAVKPILDAEIAKSKNYIFYSIERLAK